MAPTALRRAIEEMPEELRKLFKEISLRPGNIASRQAVARALNRRFCRDCGSVTKMKQGKAISYQ